VAEITHLSSETLTCPYCRGPAPLVTGREVYPHRPDLYAKPFYQCAPCGAYVGCHPGTTRSLGRLADAPLRAAKARVHAMFDPLWKSGRISRSSAYARLADAIGIQPRECHVGMFSLDLCNRAIAALSRWNGRMPERGADVAQPEPTPEPWFNETIKGVPVHTREIGDSAGKDLPW
jgi:hypothetical protein